MGVCTQTRRRTTRFADAPLLVQFTYWCPRTDRYVTLVDNVRMIDRLERKVKHG